MKHIAWTLLALSFAAQVQAKPVTAAWDANTDGVTIGYRLCYGVSPGVYMTELDVQNVTTATVDLGAGTYYIVVKAYDAQGQIGPPSNEVKWAVTVAPPPVNNPTNSDFDHDGRTDVLWRNKVTGENRVWLMDGLTVTATANVVTIGDPNWVVKGSGDFNGDGKADVIWQHKITGAVVIWLMDGLTVINSAFMPAMPSSDWEIVLP